MKDENLSLILRARDLLHPMLEEKYTGDYETKQRTASGNIFHSNLRKTTLKEARRRIKSAIRFINNAANAEVDAFHGVDATHKERLDSAAPELLFQLKQLVRCIREQQLGDYSPLMDEIFDSEHAIQLAEVGVSRATEIAAEKTKLPNMDNSPKSPQK